jgi:assimilatory nitrate reductase catalytic subunit
MAKPPLPLPTLIAEYGPHENREPSGGWTTIGEPDRVVPTHCCFCGQQCGIQLKVKDEKVVGFEPWEAFPFNRGKLCPKGVKRYLQDEHPDRLLMPLERRDGRGFAPIDWNAALDRTAREMQRIQDAYGRDAFAVLTGASLTNEKAYLMGKFARVALRTANIDYNGRLCMVSAAAASKKILGVDRSANPWSDLLKAKVILVAGANIAECAPITTDYLWQARENGARLIVLDPRMTPIARTADLFIPVRSGGDIGVFNGMLHVMIERGWINREFIAAHVAGWDAVEASLARYTPEYAAAIAGVPASMIVRAAELWGPADTSFLLHARGIEHHSKGVENCMAAINLVVATGRIGREGSGYAMITGQGNGQGAREQGQKCDQLPGARDIENPVHREHIARVWDVDEASIPHTGLSAVPLLEAIHDGRIKGLLLICFNPVVSLPDGDFIRDALSRLEFFGVIDFFMSETARYADIVFPGSLMEEDEGTTTSVEGRVIHHRQVVKPPADAREDWRIVCDLAERLGAGDKFAYHSTRDLRRTPARVERRRRRLWRHHVGAHRSRDGRLLAVPVRRSSGHAAPLRRRTLRPRRRKGPRPTRRVASCRRRTGRGLSDRTDNGTRRVAIPVGDADPTDWRARRSVSGAEMRDASASRRVARRR